VTLDVADLALHVEETGPQTRLLMVMAKTGRTENPSQTKGEISQVGERGSIILNKSVDINRQITIVKINIWTMITGSD
jgi:hypothetical protein